MPGRINKHHNTSRPPAVTRSGRGIKRRSKPPFWLPASGFYTLAAAVSLAIFFLLWGMLHEGREDTPWIGAGLGASIVLGSAVFLREIVLRGSRERYLAEQRRLDRTIRSIPLRFDTAEAESKLTLEKNAAILRRIQKKSDAAKVLNRLSEGHKEVFDLCEEYLRIVERELPGVAPGSPRLTALWRGERLVREVHHHHLLRWAEIEAKSYTQEAGAHVNISDRIDSFRRAIGVVDHALTFYPNEPALQESLKALRDIADSLRLTELLESAEKASDAGDRETAVRVYNEALYFVNKGDLPDQEKQRAESEIRFAISKIERPTAMPDDDGA
jgi:hypothetical protein